MHDAIQKMTFNNKYFASAVELPAAGSITSLEVPVFLQLSEIHTLSVGPTGILLSDEFNHAVISFGNSGELNWVTTGADATDNSGFRYPRGLLYTGDKIWICDSLNHRLVALDTDGNTIDVLDNSAIDLHEPSDLKFYEDDMFFVVEKRRHRLLLLNTRGALLSTLGRRERKYTIKQKKLYNEFVNPFLDPASGLTQQFLWQYPNQVSWDGDRLWSTDNSKLLVNGRDSEVILKVETKDLVTYRGLTAFEDGCLFLEERSGAICLVDLSGRMAVLYAGDSRISGCGRAPDERIALLIGDKIHFYSFSKLNEYAVKSGAFSESGADQITRFFNTEKQHSQAENNILFDSIIKEKDTDTALNILLSAGIAKSGNTIVEKVGSYLLGCLDNQLKQLTSEFSRLVDWGENPVIAGSEVVTPIVVVPNAKEMLQADRYNADFRRLVSDIYSNLRLLERLRINLGIWEENRLIQQRSGEKNLIKQAFSQNSNILIALCRLSAEMRRKSLLKAIDILAESENEPSGKSVRLAYENVLFTLSSQIMEVCIRLLHMLVCQSVSAEDGKSDDGKLRTIALQGVYILMQYFLYPEASVRYLSSKKTRQKLKPETRKLVANYATLVVKIINVRTEFIKESKRELHDVLEYSNLVWSLIGTIDQIGLVTGASLNFFWDKSVKAAIGILNSIGFGNFAESLEEIAPDKAGVDRAPEEIYRSLLTKLNWINENNVDIADLVDRTLSRTQGDLKILQQVIQILIFNLPPSSLPQFLETIGNRVTNSSAEHSDKLDFLVFCATSSLSLGQKDTGWRILEMAGSFNTNRELATQKVAQSIDPYLAPDIKIPLLERSRKVRFSPSIAWDHDSLVRFYASNPEHGSYNKLLSQFTLHPSFIALNLLTNTWEQQNTISRCFRIRKGTFTYSDTLADSLYSDMASKGDLLLVLDYMKSDHRWRDNGASIRLQAARILKSLDRFDDALSLIREWEHVSGPSVVSLSLTRQIYLQKGDFEKAYNISRNRVITGGSEEKQALNNVIVHIDRNDYSAAQKCLDSVPDNSPLKKHKEILQGRLALKQFNPVDAMSIFQSLLLEDPENDSLRFLVLATKLHTGHVDEVLNLSRLAASIGLNNPPLDTLAIGALQQKENWATANILCRKQLIINPGDYIAAFLYSTGLLNSAPSEADVLFNEGFHERYPWISHASMINASILTTKDPVKALNTLERKDNVITSKDALHNVIRSIIATKCGKSDEAISALTSLVGKFGLEEIHFALAHTLIGAGYQKEASEVLEPLRVDYAANPVMQRLERSIESSHRKKYS